MHELVIIETIGTTAQPATKGTQFVRELQRRGSHPEKSYQLKCRGRHENIVDLTSETQKHSSRGLICSMFRALTLWPWNWTLK